MADHSKPSSSASSEATIQKSEGPQEPAVTIERESILESNTQEMQVKTHDGPLQDDPAIAQARETLTSQTAEIMADHEVAGMLDFIRVIRRLIGNIDLDKLMDLIELIGQFQAIDKPWDEAGISERLQIAMKILRQVTQMTENEIDDRIVAGATALFENDAIRKLVASLLARLLDRQWAANYDFASQSIGDVAVGDELDTMMVQAAIDWPTLVNLIRFAWELFLRIRG